MDKHLNLFRTFSQKEDKQTIEDNLSRALVLCMKNDHLFYHELLRQILNEEDYNRLFSHYNSESILLLDLQRNLRDESASEYTKVYAIALTGLKHEMKDFLNSYQYHRPKDYRPVTDIHITLGDILIIIEVKRSDEDCRQQLYNQLHQLFAEKDDEEVQVDHDRVVPKSFTWKSFIEIAMRVGNFQQFTGGNNIFLRDFISLMQSFNPEWIPIPPYSSLTTDDSDDALRKLRLQTAIKAADGVMPILEYSDRLGFNFQESWAVELLYWISKRKEDGETYLYISMWPGNTKSQGWSLYYHDNLKWHDKLTIKIQGRTYDLIHKYHLKFTSFQKYFTSIDFIDEDLKEGHMICNAVNFNEYSGRKKRDEWKRLANFFDDSFHPNFNWREHCKWNEKVLESGKTQFDISFGFQCYVRIPYSDLQEIDKEIKNGKGLNQFVMDAYRAFKELNS